MSNYISLARKWRPQQFTDVVGQSTITQTLSQAISKNRVHCGYLFTGSRGIGKTSIARIFAKNLRCEHTQTLNHTLITCDQCSNCHEITLSTSIDVIEIDGASNNGVDAVRDLREGARFLPSSGSRKIYIIDEVHMLTTQAFNALLKILEEPPEHIVFIFATTEPHKIPATILSRCQRFDFKRPPPHIKSRLIEVLQKEEIKFEDGALRLIAQAADGSLRDALSLLDQVIAYAGDFISTQSVHESIGFIQNEVPFKTLTSIFQRAPEAALTVVEDLYNEGHDLKIFIKSILEHLHAITLFKVGYHPKNTSSFTSNYTEEEIDFLKARAQDRSLEEIELIFQVFHHGLELLSHSPFPKVILDFLVIKTALAEGFITATAAQENKQIAPTPVLHQNSPQQKIFSTEQPPASQVITLKKEPLHKENPEGLIAFIAQKRPLLASLLEHAYHFVLEEPKQNATQKLLQLKVYFLTADGYKKDQLSTPLYMKQLIEFSEQFFNHPVELLLDVKDEEGKISFAALKLQSGQAHEEKIKNEIESNPIIQEAQSLFGSKVGPIRILQPQQQNELNLGR